MPDTKILDSETLFAQLKPIYSHAQVARWRNGQAAIHLALMQGEFLNLIIDGTKSIESRMTKARIAPVGDIDEGDLVVFKQVGRDRMAVGIVERALTGALDAKAWKFIRKHADEIGVEDDYLEYKSDSRYYALIWMTDVHVINSIQINKKDRRAWVVIRTRSASSAVD